jgi:hypothetical protein
MGMAGPARPGIVLRIAVAGNRTVDDETALATRMGTILDAIEAAIASIPADRTSSSASPDHDFVHSAELPSVRLVSGLADGADQIASDVMLVRPADRFGHSIAAILPFDVDTYRDRSPIRDVPRFERLLARCRYILELDGHYPDASAIGEAAARQVRAAAYRAQSEVLLRHCDILIAIEDPDAVAKPGGARETIRRALYRGVPVLHLRLGQDVLAVLRSLDDLETETPARDWRTDITTLVQSTLADPRHPSPGNGSAPVIAGHGEQEMRDRRRYEGNLLQEFFSERPSPLSVRQRIWSRFERLFIRGPEPPQDDIPGPFRAWRTRATTLNRRYAGLYRGTFLLIYSLAVIAVFFAVGSLLVLILYPDRHGLAEPAGLVLAAFGLGKLGAVVAIFLLAGRANSERWNEKAVDYRYLAERLRSTAYLPRAGSLRALPPRIAGYTSRVSTQTIMDWLFQAMVRQVSLEEVLSPTGQPARTRMDPAAAATAIRDGWLANQAHYHRRNADAMHSMSNTFELTGAIMNYVVVGVVGIDIGILAGVALGWLPHGLEKFSPWLLFLAAILPAAIAGLNGIGFQSECVRLADRSRQMERLLAVLASRARATIATTLAGREPAAITPGSTIDVLHLAEDCAQLMLDEVAEWSFVYAKEIVGS